MDTQAASPTGSAATQGTPGRGGSPPAIAHPEPQDGSIARLARAAAAGDGDAWAELVALHQRTLAAVTRGFRLSPADAEDVVQTTWLRLVEHLPRISTPQSLRHWLATTARRECLHVLRQRARCAPTAAVPEQRMRHDDDPIDARLLRAEREQQLRAALARLPGRDRVLLELLVADPPLSYRQIGAAMDMPVGSVGPTRARSLSRLRRETVAMDLAA